MKRLAFLCSCLLSLCTCFSQDCEICELSIKKVDTVLLKDFGLPNKNSSQILFSFIDTRSDTTKIGYWETKGMKKARKEDADAFNPYQLEGGTAQGWSQLMSNRVKGVWPSGEPIKLIGFLKTFWVYHYDNSKAEKGFDQTWTKRMRLVYKADYFLLKDEKLYPFSKIDTMLISKLGDFDAADNVYQRLMDIHKTIFATINPEKVKNRNSYTPDFVRSKYITSDNHPIFAKHVQYKDGLYQNFQEFLRNDPSSTLPLKNIKSISDKKFSKMDIDSSTRIRKSWGYCENGRVYLQLEGWFFELTRTGKTFELLGFTNKNQQYPIPIPVPGNTNLGSQSSTGLSNAGIISLGGLVFDGLMATKAKAFFYPMQLDMQTGNIY